MDVDGTQKEGEKQEATEGDQQNENEKPNEQEAGQKSEAGQKQAPKEETTTYRLEKKTRQIKKPCKVGQSVYGGLPKQEVDKLLSDEYQMQADDKYEVEVSEKKNALEAYIYALRDNLSGKYETYVKSGEKETL